LFERCQWLCALPQGAMPNGTCNRAFFFEKKKKALSVFE
jgi:hypothetical protein